MQFVAGSPLLANAHPARATVSVAEARGRLLRALEGFEGAMPPSGRRRAPEAVLALSVLAVATLPVVDASMALQLALVDVIAHRPSLGTPTQLRP